MPRNARSPNRPPEPEPPLQELSSTKSRKVGAGERIGRTGRQVNLQLLPPGGSAQRTERLTSRCSGPGPPREVVSEAVNHSADVDVSPYFVVGQRVVSWRSPERF